MTPENTTDPGEKHPERRRYVPRLIVKFHDYVDLPYEDGVERHFEQQRIGPWDALVQKYPGLTFRRYFTALEPGPLRDLTQRAEERDSTYQAPDLLNWFAIEVPAHADREEVLRAIRSWSAVEKCYVEPEPVPPPAVAPADDPRWTDQGYLDPAPDGIDAEYAWNFAGGDGAGVGFVDLEQGWTLNHEDLVAHGIALISGVNQAYWGHGTSVLGEVAAVDNSLGCVGITPNLTSVRVVSEWRDPATYNTGDAILSALPTMDFGDVLLLESQDSIAGFGLVPNEAVPAYFDAIRLATALGIIVVEAAANGGNDLDTFTDGGGLQVLNRGSMATN